jgi:hypothetical protein
MTNEDESFSAHLEFINIDLKNKAVEIQAEGGTALRFTYTPRGVLMQLTLKAERSHSPTDDVVGPPIPAVVSEPMPEIVAETPAPAKTKTPAETISGKLQTKPTEGRPDGRGNPTAWARFLAHREGNDGALLVSATFHSKARELALGLDAGDQITAQGYYHPSRDPHRLSTFSIFHLMNYPGKRVNQADGGQLPAAPPPS